MRRARLRRRGIEIALPFALVAGRGRLFRLGQRQHAGIVVVFEDLGEAAPVDHLVEHAVGLLVAEIVLEFLKEAALGGAVSGALVEDAADVAGKRDVAQKMLAPTQRAVLIRKPTGNGGAR